MTKITKEELKALRIEIDEALKTVAQKHNLQSLRAGKATFTNEGSFTFKLEGLVSGGLSPEAQRYNQIKTFLNLPDLGAEVTLRNGKRFIIFGINTTGTKVFAKSIDNGSDYWINVESVSLNKHLVLPSDR